ncbi:MAG TPA: VOC family protein [Gemmatimonadaceae bacterium]|nr:VOC family protein [Gemmatimonadaceae bacterium]
MPFTSAEHLQIPATDVPRAIAFYQHVFGFDVESFADGTCWFSTPRIDNRASGTGVIRARTAQDPNFVNYFRVASLEEVTTRVSRHGGRVLIPRSLIAGSMWFAYCQDTEGNRFAIEQCASPQGLEPEMR